MVFENAGPSGWGAYVPDLPGCTAGGATYEDALVAIRESIELWIEDADAQGEPIPPATSQAASVAVAV